MAKPLSTAKQRVLEHLKRSDGATAAEVAEALGITEAAVRQHIDVLVERGLVERRALPRYPGRSGTIAARVGRDARRRRASSPIATVSSPSSCSARFATRSDPTGSTG